MIAPAAKYCKHTIDYGMISAYMKNIAVLLAAGKGSRFGGLVPKQFLSLLGKPVFLYSALVFERHPAIDGYYIVADRDAFPFIEKTAKKYRLRKMIGLIQGGKTRTQSSLAFLSAMEPADRNEAGNQNILFHDAARPLLTEKILSACLEKLRSFPAVTAAVHSINTIFLSDGSGTVAACPPRPSMMIVQTPQGFRRDIIEKAYSLAVKSEENAQEENDGRYFGTDDCAVVFRHLPDVRIAFSEGAETNIKLTYREDIFLAEKFLRMQRRSRGNPK